MTIAVKLQVTMAGGSDTVLSEHAIEKDVLAIGRIMGNDVVLPDVEKRVSSKHARIEKDGAAWRVVDLGSTHGTFLNDLRLETQVPAPLKNGDVISIGPFRLRFTRRESPDGPGRGDRLLDVLRRLDPASIEAEVQGAGPQKAWDRYAEIYKEILAEHGRRPPA